MKKILIFIIFVFSLFMTNDVFAVEYYEKVSILTSFEEKIDLNKIESIYLTIEYQSGRELDLVLNKNDNYSIDLNDVIKEPIKISMAIVKGDNVARFDISSNVEYTTETQVVVNLMVREREITTNKIDIDQDLLDKIYNQETTTTSTNINDNEPDRTTTTSRIITNSKGEIITTKSSQEIKKEEKELEEKQKEIETKAKNSIYIIVFSAIGIIVVCVIIYAAIKISRANK